MICKLLAIFLVSGVNTTFIGYVERCPTREERRFIRPHPKCLTGETYHCMKDDEFDLVETCNKYIQLPQGYYPRYTSFSDRVFYDACPIDKYQPWPVKSYEIAECELDKSSCSGVGQIPCNAGTTTSDVTCACDNSKGFVMTGTSRCCSPSGIDDCFCQYRPCKIKTQELNSDYICVEKCPQGYKRLPGQNDCSPTPSTTDSMRNVTIVTLTPVMSKIDTGIIKHFDKNLMVKLIVTLFAVCFFVVMSGTAYYIYKHDFEQERITFTEDYDLQVFQLLDAASKGDMKTLRSLQSQGYVDIYETDYDNRSALHLAACEGKFEVVKYLLNHGAYPSAKDRCMRHTAVEDAIWHRDRMTDTGKKTDFESIIELLNSHKGSPKQKEHFRDMIALKLITAAKNGEISTLERFHRLNTDMNLADAEGQTALHAAAEMEQRDIVEFLLVTCEVSPFVKSRGKKPRELVKNDDKQNMLPLFTKCEDESSCIAAPPWSEVSEELQKLRLLNYASRGDIRRLRGMKNAGYNMGLVDYDNRSALHIAVSDGQEHIVDFLLGDCDLGSHPENREDRWGQTPLNSAKELGKRHIFRKFLKHCPNVVDTESEEYKTFSLLMAGYKGDKATLERLYKNGINMNMQDYDGRTALHLAAAENKRDAVEYLITKCDCRRDIQDRNGNFAGDEIKDENLKESFPNMVFKPNLSFKRAAVPAKLRARKTIIKTSTFSGLLPGKQPKTFEETSDKKAKLKPDQIKDSSDMYEMYNATGTGNLEKLKECEYLDLERGDYLKNTPLHIAAINGHVDIVKYLVEDNHVSLFIRNKAMETAFDSVNAHLKLLIDRPATFFNIEQRKMLSGIRNYLDKRMKTAENLKDEIKEDSSFLKYDDDVKTFMLLNKAFKGDIRAIRGYIQTDKNIINNSDYDQRTALHIAVAEKHTHLVKYFLESDDLKDIIKPNEKDRWGKTPKDEAEGFKELEDLFSSLKRVS